MRLKPGDEPIVTRIAGIPEETAVELLADPDTFVLQPAPGCLFLGQPLFVGAVSVHQFAEVGSRGLKMLRAGRAAVAWCWEHTQLQKIVGFTPAPNRPACVMAEAIGFKREGLLLNARRGEHGLHDVVVFGISRPDTEVAR